MTPICLNYPLNSSSKALHCGTQLLLWYFGPCFHQRWLQSINIVMRWGTGLSLQHGPHTEVHWIEIRWWGRPQFLAPKLGKIGLTPFLSLLGRVWGSAILLEGEFSIFEMFFHFTKSTHFDVHICIHLHILFHKNQRRLPRFGHCCPYHDRCWFLATISSQNVFRNVSRLFC